MADKILIKNIKALVGTDDGNVLKKSGKQMSELGTIENAFLLLEDGVIKDFGQQTSNFQLLTSKPLTPPTNSFFPHLSMHTHILFLQQHEKKNLKCVLKENHTKKLLQLVEEF